jgi:hypothetical protein
MSLSRSWLDQEKNEKAMILKKFWDERVNVKDEDLRNRSLESIKNHFLLSLPREGVSHVDWREEVEKAWLKGFPLTKDGEKEFLAFFEHIPSCKSVGYGEGLISEPPAKDEVHVTESDLNALKQYTEDRNITVTSALGSCKTEVKPFCSEGYTPSDVFTTQSITKVFTGVLALRLMEEGIISADDLEKPPMKLADSAEKLLANHPKILARLKETTLHQAMTHQAGLGVGTDVGFGDYYSNYMTAIETAREEKSSVPEIKGVEDFLQFVPNQTSEHFGKGHELYSNSGIVLTALSLEHLYEQHRLTNPHKNLEKLNFDGMMKKYVTGAGAANMIRFEASPKDLNVKFNPEDKNADQMVGTPGGGYYSTIEDLAKFAKWMHEKCQDPKFVKLIENYGQEFCHTPKNKTIEHTGDGPSNSAFFSLNWETGNLVVVLNDQRARAGTEVGLEIKSRILSQSIEIKLTHKSDEENKPISSTAFMASRGINISSPDMNRPSITPSLDSSYPLGKQSNMSVTTKMDNSINEENKHEASEENLTTYRKK